MEITYKTEYDPTNRFVSKQSTLPVSTQTSYLYDTWGNVTSQTDETNLSNLLTTIHSYSNWGRKTSTTLSDGRKTTYHTGWNDNDPEKKYFTLTQGKAQPWVKTWYDATGRETASESIGPKEMKIESTKSYNTKGELINTWNRQGNLFTVGNYTYDARGRILVQSIQDGQSIRYSYDNRTVTTTTNGTTTVKTFDAWGGIKTVADPLSGNVAYTYKSGGKPSAIDANGAISTMDYDEVGNQKLLKDPNAGTTTYTYDAAGRVKTQVDNKGDSLVVNYDEFGRTTTSILKGIETKNTYGATGFETFRLTKVETGANSVNYIYDELGRPITEERHIDGEDPVEFAFSYNPDGQLQTTTYPGVVQVNREYDAYGNQVKVLAQGQTIWELTGATGKETTSRLGGTMTATSIIDAQGQLTTLKTMKGNTVVRDMGFGFNAQTGNLSWRTGMLDQKETFHYDDLDRLTSVGEGTPELETMAIGYQENGNISSKTGLGAYVYDGFKPHAVALVDYNMNLMPSTVQSITYNAFNKADCLKDTVDAIGYQLDILYGPDQQRWKSVLKRNGTDEKTIIFAGDYEKFIDNGVTRELYYIGAGEGLAAVYVKPQSGAASMYYAHTDHLGSIVSLTDSAGTAVFNASYDAWGRQTVGLNTIGFHRGYTGHEHLPEFGLINMNGRMYDPLLGRFLSPDNYVQAADFSQSFNRYSYCINNPLKYTDPSGNLFWIIPNIGWSKDGGLNIGLSFVVGIPGGLSAQAGIGYSFGSNDAYGFVGATSSMNTWHASFSSNSGVSVGNTFGLSPFSGLPISTNFATVGVNYNISRNSGSGNVSAWQVDQSGATFNPSVSAMIFPEQTTNLVRSGKFINNNAMLNNFTDAGNYQGALDYFGLKGTYDPNSEYAGYVNKSEDIIIGKLAFEINFDYLSYATSEERFHQNDLRSGNYKGINWDDKNSFETIRAQNTGEFKAKNYQYRNQGLFRKAYGNNTTNRIISDINSYGFQIGNPSFTYKNWHLIYKIPRKW